MGVCNININTYQNKMCGCTGFSKNSQICLWSHNWEVLHRSLGENRNLVVVY